MYRTFLHKSTFSFLNFSEYGAGRGEDNLVRLSDIIILTNQGYINKLCHTFAKKTLESLDVTLVCEESMSNHEHKVVLATSSALHKHPSSDISKRFL